VHRNKASRSTLFGITERGTDHTPIRIAGYPIWGWSESDQKSAVCITTMSDKPREQAHRFNGYEFSGWTSSVRLKIRNQFTRKGVLNWL